ncbi:MAG TPA: hypothetical protein VFN43_07690 [Humibacillus sp.]|nr:hypothetical protein [Humibacillus sp.]
MNWIELDGKILVTQGVIGVISILAGLALRSAVNKAVAANAATFGV